MKIGQVQHWVSESAMGSEYAADLGDERRNRRARQVGSALAAKPELSLPKVFPDEADLEAAYRLLRNPAVAWRDLAAPHVERTLARAAQGDEVVVAHDTSDVALRTYWSDELRGQMSSFSSRTQGFFIHTSLAITARGRALPLGVVDVQPFVHRSGLDPADTVTQAFWESEAGLFENEHARWCRGVAIASDELAARGVSPIHVMDQETDSYGLLSWMAKAGHRFVVRCDGGRSLKCEAGLRDVGMVSADLGERFELRTGSKADSHPTRRARTALLTVRAGVVTLKRAQRAKDASWSPGGFDTQPTTLDLHLVEAVELNPPPGEKGVRWLLLTTEPIEMADDVLRVIDLYRRRWLIEEYFKGLKTGCRLEQRQMESMDTMLCVLALLIPAAWRLLLLRAVVSEAPETTWKHLLTALEFRILTRAVPKAKLQASATIAQCVAAIAKLGGHLPRNGAPGWQTLHAGWRQLQDLALGARLARGDAIND